MHVYPGGMTKLEATKLAEREQRGWSTSQLIGMAAELGWKAQRIKRKEFRNVKVRLWVETTDDRGRRTIGFDSENESEIHARTCSTTFISGHTAKRLVEWARSEAEDRDHFERTCPI